VPLVLVPLAERDSLSDFPFRFNIAMGVRRRDHELRDSLDALLARKQPEIQAILKQYNVPVFPVVEEAEDDDGPPPKPTG
jgi:mxaJ protein